jgi:transposase
MSSASGFLAWGFLWTPTWAIMALEGVPEMTTKSTKTNAPDRGRFSANRKTDAVLRLLRGEDLESLSRELGVTAATLSSWRDAFLDGGRAAMRSRPADDRDELIARLQAEVGQLTMDNELLGARCQHLESGRPFVTGRRSG